MMKDLYEGILNKISVDIYENDKIYNPNEFFLKLFNVDIKIDYRKNILKKLEKDVSIFISVFHFFWEENNIIIDSRGYEFLSNDNYNRFRDAYSEGIYDLLNALFLLSIGSPIQSTTLVRRAFEGLINGVYSITKENDRNTGKEEKLISIFNSVFNDNKLNKMFEESLEYKNLETFLEKSLINLGLKSKYDNIKSKIKSNRGSVKDNLYFIYEYLSDYAHIYEKYNKETNSTVNKELRVIHAHKPGFDKFDKPNDLFNIICGLYIPFLFVSIEILYSNKEITDKEYNEITERFVN